MPKAIILTTTKEYIVDSAFIWDIVKTILSWAWIPIGLYMNFKLNKENKKDQKQEQVEGRLIAVELQTKTNTLQIDMLRRTQEETREDIKEVKRGIEKLVDRWIDNN